MEQPMTLEQEIEHLQKQIETKKAELGHEPERKEAAPDKEILHEIVGQNIQKAAQDQVQTQPTTPVPPPPVVDAPSYADPELQPKVQELVNIAFTKNITEAVKEVAKINNPALTDAFHDVLVDQLYDELVKRQKVEQLP